MLPSFLLSLREGIEAALIIGIVLGALRKMRRTELIPAVWLGTVLAASLSLLGGILLTSLGLSFEGAAEQIFEGVTMLLAAAMLTWMIFWMSRTAPRPEKQHGRRSPGRRPRRRQRGVFFVAFLAVVREGIELALFLTASVFATDTLQTLLGALLGLGTAILLGWSIFAATIRLDLRRFFQVTGILLILFAAGLVAHGVHEFNEVGWIPAVIEHVWDVNAIVDENSTFGQLLKALFGYNGNPSLTEMLAYVAYFVGGPFGLRGANKPRPVIGEQASPPLTAPASPLLPDLKSGSFFIIIPCGVARPAVEGRYNHIMLNNEILESIRVHWPRISAPATPPPTASSRSKPPCAGRSSPSRTGSSRGWTWHAPSTRSWIRRWNFSHRCRKVPG